ncbi:MAG: valine--tRNA ligase [Planctomycetota bacterium]
MSDLPETYDPQTLEPQIQQGWLKKRAFAANTDHGGEPYVVMMPLPNVTGALHMGHAMDNVMQDLLTRWHRMRGFNTLWQPGTDHAGIATQQVVETRLKDLEGKTRHDIGREALVERIWAWKDEYQARIISQQQKMGCSCDWDRQRFTMDPVCARAVRHTFFKMFQEGLIYRGDRLVNWDCHLQTAVADDELVKVTVQGHFWHLRYPVLDPKPGEPEHIIVATTRPETMLGDTAVACHPDPARALDELIQKAEERLQKAPKKDKEHVEKEIENLRERKATALQSLELVASMAKDGRKLRLPLMDREIPLILDEWAKPELGSGCVKITPAHDPNDHEVWQRHKDEIGLTNILEEDGSIAPTGGVYAGLDRFDARKKVVSDLDAQGLLDKVEDRSIEIDHSDRSKTIVEPFMSKQWFVRMGDRDGGVLFGAGTDKEFRSPGLAQAAMDAADGQWTSATDRKVRFWPDQDRYHGIYHSWLKEKRDWCISRQLWWGHRIPVWRGTFSKNQLLQAEGILTQEHEGMAAWVVLSDDTQCSPADAIALIHDGDPRAERVEALLCILDPQKESNVASMLETVGMRLEEDVLDTWFSSALWPHSTLGWPDPATAGIEDGQTKLGGEGAAGDSLQTYYPGSCLVTGRDIITLWVARMVVMGLYNVGDLPFEDVFLHATIQDGRGERMSKSKGNGVDPIDMVDRYGADAMRYVLCEMQTGTQDIKLPVQAVSPFDGAVVELADAKPGPHKGTYHDPKNGELFDMVGLMASEGIPTAQALSDRFDVGKAFCNKLWNAARFAFLNLEGTEFSPLDLATTELEDRWVLSRMTFAISQVDDALARFNPSQAVQAARSFFWDELCDWYLEWVKPRMQDAAQARTVRQVLATCLDQVLRLLHPFVPYVTEALWTRLSELAPERGLQELLPSRDSQLVTASWPEADAALRDEALEARIARVQSLVQNLREIRGRYSVPPREQVGIVLKPKAAVPEIEAASRLISTLAGASEFMIDPDYEKPKDAATAIDGDIECLVLGVVDVETERKKLVTERDKLLGRIKGTEGKLSNENFVSRAPANVVEGERQKLEEMKEQLARLEASLSDLEG